MNLLIKFVVEVSGLNMSSKYVWHLKIFFFEILGCNNLKNTSIKIKFASKDIGEKSRKQIEYLPEDPHVIL